MKKLNKEDVQGVVICRNCRDVQSTNEIWCSGCGAYYGGWIRKDDVLKAFSGAWKDENKPLTKDKIDKIIIGQPHRYGGDIDLELFTKKDVLSALKLLKENNRKTVILATDSLGISKIRRNFLVELFEQTNKNMIKSFPAFKEDLEK